MKDLQESVSDIKYSPSNKFMGVASNQTVIDIYNVDRGYQRACRCSGHSATIRSIDWSDDSSLIMSCSNDQELLFWNGRTGKQVWNGVIGMGLNIGQDSSAD